MTTPDPKPESAARRHKRECLPICESNRCENYGADAAGNVGCLLMKRIGRRPCWLVTHLMQMGTCLADDPLF